VATGPTRVGYERTSEGENMIFADRFDAGKRLAEALGTVSENAIILSIPRGGVVVARAMADVLHVPMDVIVVRKLGAPNNPELALGAIGPDGHVTIDEEVSHVLGQLPPGYIERESARQMTEVERRMKLYRGDRPFPDVDRRPCILVDDGIATGSTARAALRWLRARGASRLVLAVPVAPARTVTELESEADHVVCLSAPVMFMAVGQWYDRFEQVEDDEVVAALAAARRPT
jgi:putative phosphoribosyl transferase